MLFVDCINQSCNNGNIRVKREKKSSEVSPTQNITHTVRDQWQIPCSLKQNKTKQNTRVGMTGHKNSRYSRSLRIDHTVALP